MKKRLSKPQVLKIKMIPKTFYLLSITYYFREKVVGGRWVGWAPAGGSVKELSVDWWSMVGKSVEDLSVGRWLVVRGLWPVGGQWFCNTPCKIAVGKLQRCKVASCNTAK